MKPKRFRGLFYNTAPLGLGHLTLAIHLCNSFIDKFDIDYFLGSPCPYPFPDSPHFNLYQLPPLVRKDEQSPLCDPNGILDLKTILNSRQEFIEHNITEKYDFFICEHFPFGRYEVMNEISFVLKKITSINPNCLITSSFCAEKKTWNSETKNLIDFFLTNVFDTVFLQVDPNIEPADDLFKTFPQHKNKFAFTGYITDPTYHNPGLPRQKQIVISGGSGKYSDQLIRSLINTAPIMPEFTFLFILGPRSNPALLKEIEKANKKLKHPNMQCTTVLDNFLDVLSTSALSISLGGLGTVGDILISGIPSIILPHSIPGDQEFRASQLEKIGRIKTISESDFVPEKLKNMIIEITSKPVPIVNINIKGAVNTTNALDAQCRQGTV